MFEVLEAVSLGEQAQENTRDPSEAVQANGVEMLHYGD
jgi:hypothetical protein